MNEMELEKIIKYRRNIKPQFFTLDVIPDQEIKDILESANWAPTHKYTEPWRFVVFSGSSRQDFANFQCLWIAYFSGDGSLETVSILHPQSISTRNLA